MNMSTSAMSPAPDFVVDTRAHVTKFNAHRSYCAVHRQMVRDGEPCKPCAREWIHEHGDAAAKWALDQLVKLERDVSHGEYDFSPEAAEHGYSQGFADGRRHEQSQGW